MPYLLGTRMDMYVPGEGIRYGTPRAIVSTVVQKRAAPASGESRKACHLRMRIVRQAGIKYLAFPVLMPRLSFIAF